MGRTGIRRAHHRSDKTIRRRRRRPRPDPPRRRFAQAVGRPSVVSRSYGRSCVVCRRCRLSAVRFVIVHRSSDPRRVRVISRRRCRVVLGELAVSFE